ncbi:MAG: SDR family oxidoreductase [Candidatus Dadabacteria bacterium]|nr:SDR family oxidoreductase [Candidatus Dadabacteria bacterium]
MKLKDKVAVITGGNSGIGLATVEIFKENGAKVVIFGRNRESLDKAVREVGNGMLAVQGDVRNLKDLDRLFKQTAERFEMIDVLVANAGIAKFATLAEFTEELFDEICDINFKGAFFTVQKALPYLRDGASVILVGAADADKLGRPLTSIYSATKAAVRSLARTLSAELLPRKIRVNVLSPGLTQTPILTRDIGLSADVRDKIAQAIIESVPLRRLGTPEEMAKAMLFLASEDSTFFLGTEIAPDGGLAQISPG